METKISEFEEYIRKQLAECQRQSSALIAEDRKDEANIWRIKANIYDIFQTLMKVSVQQESKNGWDAVCKSFEEKAKRIPMSWKESYQRALEHEDAEKILVEEEKLAVVSNVMEFYTGQKEA